MRYAQASLILLLACVMQGTQAAEPKPGLWEFSVVTSIEATSQQFGPYHRNQCLTQEDLKNPEKLLADTGTVNCSYGDKKFQGNRFSFAISCGGELTMNGSGSVTYDTDQLEGEVDLTTDMQGIEVVTHSQVSGARAGDCTH